MTARQSRRSRRRKAPADTLPRISKGAAPRGVQATAGPVESGRGLPEHRVTTDYRYVSREMAIIGAVSALAFGFIVVMSFVV